MAHATTPSLIRQLGSLFDGGSVAGLSDRQLLDRFVARSDRAAEDAFAALVARHGPMVLHVCRQLLDDHHHAEDAFQAVFLVLAHKAASIRDADLLGNWLYGVALRTARKAKARLNRRRRLEEGDTRDDPDAAGRTTTAVEPSAPPADRPTIDCEQAQLLHDEIDRLPGAFRSPIVLCYFEGLTLEEAARRLHCPAGTVGSRLARARDKLRRGLARRGVVLPAAALAAVLESRPGSASVSSPLCHITTRAAMAFASGQVAPATALAREVLRSMLIHKLRLTAFTVLALTAFAGGAGYLAEVLAMPDEPHDPPALQAPIAPKPGDADPRPAPGRMFVVGRVLDPSGKTVPDATVMAYASPKWPGPGYRLAPMWPSAIGQAGGDGSGRFRLDAPRVSSSRNDTFGAVAIAPGYGTGWVELDPDADQPAADITLRPEQVIRGRIFDVQGRPAQGVVVSVESMGTPIEASPDMMLEEFKGPYFMPDRPDDLPAWPRPSTSDADGRFTIRGVGRGLRVGLAIEHPRYATQRTRIDTDSPSGTKNATMAVEPARIITGRVTFADTGQPAPHALVSISTRGDDGSSRWAGDFETDAQGRFHANPEAGPGYLLSAFPPEREPYLHVAKTLEWPKGAIEHSIGLDLPRGVLVRGRVTEEGTGKPIAGARVGYVSNPDRDRQSGASNTRATTATDGSFQLGVMPAPGYLTILGPDEDYVLREMGRRMALAGQPGGRRMYAHAFHALDLKPGAAGQDVAITLRPSPAVKGRVVGHDGQPIRDAQVISRVVLRPLPIAWLFWLGYYREAARDGSFAVHGLPDDAEVPVYFLDARHNRGATAMLSGRLAGEPVTVRLQPCGAARARLVDPAGKPVRRSRDTYGSHMTMLVVTPGPHRLSEDKAEQARLAADQDFIARYDPIHYEKGLVSDDQGTLTLPALIPGATYRIYDSTIGDGFNPRLRKEFTVKPGETLDLGDILIEKPPA